MKFDGLVCILTLSFLPLGKGGSPFAPSTSREISSQRGIASSKKVELNRNSSRSCLESKSFKSLLLRGGESTSASNTGQGESLNLPEENPLALSNTKEGEEDWRNQLPDQLKERKGALHRILVPTIHRKPNGSSNDRFLCQIYLIGTAHVSNSSCVDVKLLMEAVKPDMLFLELCSSRTGILEDTSNELEQIQQQHKDMSGKGKKPGIGYMVKEIIERNPGMSRPAALSTVLLNQIQGDCASKLGATIGGEFKEAFKMGQLQQKEYERWQNDLLWERAFGAGSREAITSTTQNHDSKIHDTNIKPCAIILGDRPVRLTLLRTWESLSLIGKIKIICGLFISSLRKPSAEELKKWMDSIMNDPTNDLLTKSIKELSRHFPTIKTTIIDERDTFMTAKLLQLTNMAGAYYVGQNDDRIYTIVAIVGAGHCPGILRKLQEAKHDLQKLESLENVLQGVIETKKYKLDSEGMQSVVTDVVSMDLSQS